MRLAKKECIERRTIGYSHINNTGRRRSNKEFLQGTSSE
jgi:hypothetical protein